MKGDFEKLEFQYIPREDNKKADALANNAIQKKLQMSDRTKQILQAKKEAKISAQADLQENANPTKEEEISENPH